MPKKITIRLRSVEYKGDSVGEDVSVHIKVGDKKIPFERRIRHGTIAVATKEVGTFETDLAVFEAPVTIKVTEKDALWSDKGSTESAIKFDTKESKQKEFTFEVKVRESWRLFFRRNTAMFVVNLVADVSSESDAGIVVTRIKPKPYGAVFKGKDLNRFDDEIADEVYNWNKEFAQQQLPPDTLLDPSLVKAMIYVESTMGYGIPEGDNDIMQVANPNDPALHTLTNDGWKSPITGAVAQEREWENGIIKIIDYNDEAKVLTSRESIKWGARWLYHKAQSIEGPGRVWLGWKKAVERYGPPVKPSDQKPYYVDKVWDIYAHGVDSRGTKLWGMIFLFLLLGSAPLYFNLYKGHKNTEVHTVQPSAGEVLSEAVYAKEWELPSYEVARKISSRNAVPFNLLDGVQVLAIAQYQSTDCRVGVSERETEKHLKNCTYTIGAHESDMWIMKLEEGGYGFDPGPKHNYGDYYNVGPYGAGIEQIIYGDLNRDGNLDAVVLFRVSYQRNRDFFNVVVLTRQEDASVRQIANYIIEAGAKIEDLYIENGIIFLRAYLYTDADPMCCPSDYHTLRFKITD